MFKLFLFLFFFLLNINFWNFMLLIILNCLIMLIYYPSIYNNFFNMMFFMDNMSYWLILLTMWIIFLMILSMMKSKVMNNKMIIFMVLFLNLFLIFSFSVNNYLLFYIFFEMSLIPTLYLVLGWGYQPERLLAGLYLLFYTLVASLPLLLGLLIMLMEFKIVQFMNLNLLFMNYLIYYSLIMAFLVKMPMFMVHLWLPKAHVEAPIPGSMILAAILLKLGGYGLIRIMILLLKFNSLNLLIIILSVYGGVLISFNCLRQLDLKMLIAYSSVAHMGLVLGGLFTLTYWGVNGAFFMMIAHGLCSSGMFCLANVSYERSMSRSMMINKGMLNFMPSMALWWFMLSVNNMSSPISFNLIAEISLINSIISWSKFNLILIFLLCFFSASYCYYIYAYSQHGLFYTSIFSFSNSLIREMLLMFFHWFPLNILFMKILLC